MACLSTNVLLLHLNGERRLIDFTSKELATLPLDYLIRYAEPYELLEVWGRLPAQYRTSYELQITLPCFFHYNNPNNYGNARTEIDGPPMAQKSARFVKKSYQCMN